MSPRHDSTAYGCVKWTGDRAGVDLRAACPVCGPSAVVVCNPGASFEPLTPDELDLLDVDEDLVAMTNQNGPCPECGEHGHCDTDFIGRPLYHHPREEDQD